MCGNTPTPTAGIGAGQKTRPRLRGIGRKRRPVDGERVLRADRVFCIADAGIVMEIVAEVDLAVTTVVGTIEHVRMPELIDVGRRRDLVFRICLAELEKAEIFLTRLPQTLDIPFGVGPDNQLGDPTDVDMGHLCQRTCTHVEFLLVKVCAYLRPLGDRVLNIQLNHSIVK